MFKRDNRKSCMGNGNKKGKVKKATEEERKNGTKRERIKLLGTAGLAKKYQEIFTTHLFVVSN